MNSEGADPLLVNLVLRSLADDVANGSLPDRDAYLRRFAAHEDEVEKLWLGIRDVAEDGSLVDIDQVVEALVDRLHAGSAAIECAPERIGRFVVKELLGRGGQAQVFLADDPHLGRAVAVKVLSHARFSSTLARRRFEREARVLSSLADPGICPVHERGMVDGVPFIVMPYFPRGSLAARIASPVDDEGIKEWTMLLERVARSLATAHDAGVIHRDLNPRNILFDRNDSPVIADFGLAGSPNEEISLTAEGDVFGTPPYMAPEQAAGSGRLDDARIDIYALGVTLFECIAGCRPWSAPTARALLLAAATEPPARLRSINPLVSRDLEVVVETAMARDPADRYVDARTFADDLGRASRGEPVEARPIGHLVRALRWCRRNVVLLVTASSIIALLSAALLMSLEAVADRDDALADTSTALDEKSKALERMDIALRREHALRLLTEAGQLAESDAVGAARRVIDAASITDRARVWPVARAIGEELHEEWRFTPDGWTRMIAVAADSSGRYLAAGDENGCVLIADRLERRILRQGLVHAGWVTDIESLGADRFACSGDDGTVHLVTPERTASLLQLGPSRPIAALAYDARRGRLHVLDGGDGRRSLRLDRPDEVEVHDQGRPVVRVRSKVARRSLLQSRYLVVDEERDAMWVFSRGSGRLLAMENGAAMGEEVQARRLVAGRGATRARCIDMTTVVWDSEATTTTIDGFEQRIAGIALQAQTDELAIAVLDRLSIHSLEDGRLQRVGEMRGHQGAVTNVVALPYGRWATIGDDATLRVWRRRSMGEPRRFAGSPRWIDGAHRRRVVIDDMGRGVVRDIVTDLDAHVLDGSITKDSHLAWRGESELAVVAGKELRIHDGSTGRCLHRRIIEDDPLDVAWRGDHEVLLVGRRGIARYDSRSLELIAAIDFDEELPADSVAHVQSGAPDEIVALFIRRTAARPRVRLLGLDGRIVAEWIHGGIERGSSAAIADFSADGRVVAYVARGTANVQSPSAEPRAVVRHLSAVGVEVPMIVEDDRRSVRGVAVSSDGRHCAVACEQDGTTDRHLLTIHETESGRQVWSVATPSLIAVEWCWNSDLLLAIPTRGEPLVIGTRERASIGRLPAQWPRHQRVWRSPAREVFYFEAPLGIPAGTNGGREFAAVRADPLDVLRATLPHSSPLGGGATETDDDEDASAADETTSPQTVPRDDR